MKYLLVLSMFIGISSFAQKTALLTTPIKLNYWNMNACNDVATSLGLFHPASNPTGLPVIPSGYQFCTNAAGAKYVCTNNNPYGACLVCCPLVSAIKPH